MVLTADEPLSISGMGYPKLSELDDLENDDGVSAQFWPETIRLSEHGGDCGNCNL